MTQPHHEALYPPIQPYKNGYLDVGDGHEIYYELCGNPKGFPILYLHGGPGAGCGQNDRRFFDPKKCCIIIFDQRGSKRSRPYASTRFNATYDLIEDIRKLLAHCGQRKAMFFGGSWGSTLALACAITYPETVRAMVLRGIFLSERADVRDYCEGIPNTKFPELWERFISHVPLSARENPAEYYFKQMISVNSGLRGFYAYEWAYYESARSTLEPTGERELHQKIMNGSYLSCSVLEAYYIRILCFLNEGFILKNADRIPKVPVSIIHGRYDDVCSVEGAFRLHRAIPGSSLHVVVAGHARTEPEIQKKLVSETARIISES